MAAVQVAEMTCESVEFDRLVLLSDMQVRRKTDARIVKQCRQAMSAGEVFPPVGVAEVSGALVLIDGFHRVAAMRALGLQQALADVQQVATLEEARWLAAQANLRHGLAVKSPRPASSAISSSARSGDRAPTDAKNGREGAEGCCRYRARRRRSSL